MVLNAFDLTGKVAIVTGCDTGLGQGMTLGLAQAGCDIVGVNRKIPMKRPKGSGAGPPLYRHSGRSQPAG
jgi:NAD(P)-dependent dehydrogenase (short-subunit alcohol dehydrogenase family)